MSSTALEKEVNLLYSHLTKESREMNAGKCGRSDETDPRLTISVCICCYFQNKEFRCQTDLLPVHYLGIFVLDPPIRMKRSDEKQTQLNQRRAVTTPTMTAAKDAPTLELAPVKEMTLEVGLDGAVYKPVPYGATTDDPGVVGTAPYGAGAAVVVAEAAAGVGCIKPTVGVPETVLVTKLTRGTVKVVVMVEVL